VSAEAFNVSTRVDVAWGFAISFLFDFDDNPAFGEKTDMRAMRAEKFSGYEGLKLVDLPKPALTDRRVLLRVTAAGVTPLDHTIVSGHFPRTKAPLGLGNEGAGVVEEGGGADFPAGLRVMFTGNRAVTSTIGSKRNANSNVECFGARTRDS
jgi:threonine dehydrogenase-like Zn-dependent dehydrogenase